jgi:hypothetical protein
MERFIINCTEYLCTSLQFIMMIVLYLYHKRSLREFFLHVCVPFLINLIVF